MVGFLPFNWYPARVFLGDVGAIPVGFVSGWLLISLAMTGQWAAALILPLYYVADATLTLLRRLLHGDKPWEAHREHFYQRATPVGTSHATTALKVLAADCALIALAVASIWILASIPVAIAVAIVAMFLLDLRASSKR
jgi:UDP-N-acetylmuramyl pentapeptide phosphotransferase/UDP-N-acetylglucosamine-1-phosphate transferase